MGASIPQSATFFGCAFIAGPWRWGSIIWGRVSGGKQKAKNGFRQWARWGKNGLASLNRSLSSVSGAFTRSLQLTPSVRGQMGAQRPEEKEKWIGNLISPWLDHLDYSRGARGDLADDQVTRRLSFEKQDHTRVFFNGRKKIQNKIALKGRGKNGGLITDGELPGLSGSKRLQNDSGVRGYGRRVLQKKNDGDYGSAGTAKTGECHGPLRKMRSRQRTRASRHEHPPGSPPALVQRQPHPTSGKDDLAPSIRAGLPKDLCPPPLSGAKMGSANITASQVALGGACPSSRAEGKDDGRAF